jgi:hypothetical protein
MRRFVTHRANNDLSANLGEHDCPADTTLYLCVL